MILPDLWNLSRLELNLRALVFEVRVFSRTAWSEGGRDFRGLLRFLSSLVKYVPWIVLASGFRGAMLASAYA